MLNVFVSRQRPHYDYEVNINKKFEEASRNLKEQGVAKFAFMTDAVLKGQPANYPDIDILIFLKSATIIQYTIKGRFMSR